jgi:hypothetical protein
LTCVADQQQALICALAGSLGGGGDMSSLFSTILGAMNGSVCLPCGGAGGLGGIPGFP